MGTWVGCGEGGGAGGILVCRMVVLNVLYRARMEVLGIVEMNGF